MDVLIETEVGPQHPGQIRVQKANIPQLDDLQSQISNLRDMLIEVHCLLEVAVEVIVKHDMASVDYFADRLKQRRNQYLADAAKRAAEKPEVPPCD